MTELSVLTTQCIRCGFCLESCPTFTETGSELESPRGRIYLVRSAIEGKLRWKEDVEPHLDLCLGCRACETSCPSGVQYGQILEESREILARSHGKFSKKALLTITTSRPLMTAQAAVSKAFPGARIPSAVSRWLSGSNGEVDLPTPQPAWQPPALDESALPPVRGEVYLLQGCAMDVLFPRVHVATRRLLRRIGFIVRDVPKACCGAMHAHNGELEEARDRARHLIHTMPNDLPVIVNSAGCGSTMKEFSKLLGTEAEGYASRTFDLSEFLVKHGLQAQLAQSPGLSEKITYHDACHLAHGQRITSPPRELLHAIPHAEVIPLPEADTCCGSAGIYNVLQPAMARRLLDRKMSHIQATGARIVVLGNPGCHAWMAQGAAEQGRIAEQGGIDERGGISVLHTAEILEASFIGLTSLFNSVG